MIASADFQKSFDNRLTRTVMSGTIIESVSVFEKEDSE